MQIHTAITGKIKNCLEKNICFIPEKNLLSFNKVDKIMESRLLTKKGAEVTDLSYQVIGIMKSQAYVSKRNGKIFMKLMNSAASRCMRLV